MCTLHPSAYLDSFHCQNSVFHTETNNNRDLQNADASRRSFPPPPHPSVEDLLVRGWGVFSLLGHIPLNRLPSFSSPSSILSLSLLTLFVPLMVPSSSSAPHAQLSSFSLLSASTKVLFFCFTLLSISLSLPFRSSSSCSAPAPLQPCIIRPKHKAEQAHIWKEFGHGSFLPGRLNI